MNKLLSTKTCIYLFSWFGAILKRNNLGSTEIEAPVRHLITSDGLSPGMVWGIPRAPATPTSLPCGWFSSTFSQSFFQPGQGCDHCISLLLNSVFFQFCLWFGLFSLHYFPSKWKQVAFQFFLAFILSRELERKILICSVLTWRLNVAGQLRLQHFSSDGLKRFKKGWFHFLIAGNKFRGPTTKRLKMDLPCSR